MGLYLCIFDGEDELDGVEIGSYADFNSLRACVTDEIEGGKVGSRFPTFIMHSDCDGDWSPEDCHCLRAELVEIIAALKLLPPVNFNSEWQRAMAKQIGLRPKTAFESFIDVDGEFLLYRLQNLVDKAIGRQLPVLFQ
jgi:hypothetical protein